jgi:hypothetical protein
MTSSDRTNPSDAKSTVIGLDKNQIYFHSVPQKPEAERRGFREASSELQDLLRNQDLPSADDAFQILQVPFSDLNDEGRFDMALFKAIKECLKTCIWNDVDREYFLVRRTVNGMVGNRDLAVGLARYKAMLRDISLTEVPGKICLPCQKRGDFMSYESKSKHGLCLFERGIGESSNNTWKVTDCLSLVELTTNEKACADFEPDTWSKGHINSPEQHGVHRALGQALLYTLGGVLPFHARRGILAKSLPVAIIAAKEKAYKRMMHETDPDTMGTDDDSLEEGSQSDANKQNSAIKLRWVSASIQIPEACGDWLTYSVHDFDRFCKDLPAERKSIEQALVLYIETVAFGLKSALTILSDIDSGVKPPPKPASGQFLKIGKRALDWPLCASPIPGVNAIHHASGRHWTISQGELFSGTLNLRETFDGYQHSYVLFLDDDAANETVQVLVKVSSRAVHFHLIEPSYAFSALERINLYPFSGMAMATLVNTLGDGLEGISSKEVESILASAALAREISSVLYAVVATSTGMVTIMSDLSAQGYTTLSAAAHKDKLSVLWAGFQVLVTKVLLPMAAKRMVHVDIRPGFDETSNVLVKFKEGTATTEGEETTSEWAIMKLIDYESVVGITNWRAPFQSGNYIKSDFKWTATTFVWWQCLAVAYAWKKEILAKTFANNKVDNALVRCLTKELGSLLPAEFERYANESNIPKEIVMTTLAELAKHFQ